MSSERSGKNLRCQCGAVHYDVPQAPIWTCGFCGREHVMLTREEGRAFMQSLAGEEENPGP